MNLFEQDDYKEAIKLYLRARGKAQGGSLKNIADYLGVHPTLISQILSGPKDFTEEQIFSVCEFLGLPKLEAQYLLLLVQIERAGSKKLREHYQEAKTQFRKHALQVAKRINKNREFTEHERAIFYSSWIYSAVHVASSLDTKVDFSYVCERFDLNPARAREILDFLLQAQLIKEKGGRLVPGAVSTHLEAKSPFVIKHHTNWRLKAISAVENLQDDELIFSSNFSLSQKDFAALREDLVQVIQRFLGVIKESPAEEIAQFNIDFFRLRK